MVKKSKRGRKKVKGEDIVSEESSNINVESSFDKLEESQLTQHSSQIEPIVEVEESDKKLQLLPEPEKNLKQIEPEQPIEETNYKEPSKIVSKTKEPSQLNKPTEQPSSPEKPLNSVLNETHLQAVTQQIPDSQPMSEPTTIATTKPKKPYRFSAKIQALENLYVLDSVGNKYFPGQCVILRNQGDVKSVLLEEFSPEDNQILIVQIFQVSASKRDQFSGIVFKPGTQINAKGQFEFNEVIRLRERIRFSSYDILEQCYVVPYKYYREGRPKQAKQSEKIFMLRFQYKEASKTVSKVNLQTMAPEQNKKAFEFELEYYDKQLELRPGLSNQQQLPSQNSQIPIQSAQQSNVDKQKYQNNLLQLPALDDTTYPEIKRSKSNNKPILYPAPPAITPASTAPTFSIPYLLHLAELDKKGKLNGINL